MLDSLILDSKEVFLLVKSSFDRIPSPENSVSVCNTWYLEIENDATGVSSVPATKKKNKTYIVALTPILLH